MASKCVCFVVPSAVEARGAAPGVYGHPSIRWCSKAKAHTLKVHPQNKILG